MVESVWENTHTTVQGIIVTAERRTGNADLCLLPRLSSAPEARNLLCSRNGELARSAPEHLFSDYPILAFSALLAKTLAGAWAGGTEYRTYGVNFVLLIKIVCLCSVTQITEQLKFSPSRKGFSPQMGGNPFQRVKIFFGCRFGDFVMIPL
jgi:hypothetical protein